MQAGSPLPLLPQRRRPGQLTLSGAGCKALLLSLVSVSKCLGRDATVPMPMQLPGMARCRFCQAHAGQAACAES